MKKNIYIVSDVFKSLSNGQNILLLEQLISMIKTDKLNYENMVVHIEQGISEKESDDIKKLIDNRCIVMSPYDNFIRCPSKFTHKVKPFNTLISEPVKISDSEYMAILMIDSRCAELSDHVTGKHIQFMVLIEAARQISNAVTEKYYSDGVKIYLANTIHIDFISFVYPFQTKLNYKIQDIQFKSGRNGFMVVKVEFVQFDKIVANIEIKFSILDTKFVGMIEDIALKEIVNKK